MKLKFLRNDVNGWTKCHNKSKKLFSLIGKPYFNNQNLKQILVSLFSIPFQTMLISIDSILNVEFYWFLISTIYFPRNESPGKTIDELIKSKFNLTTNKKDQWEKFLRDDR